MGQTDGKLGIDGSRLYSLTRVRLRRVGAATDFLVRLWVLVTLWLVGALAVGTLSHPH
jgi:hypothetical protein